MLNWNMKKTREKNNPQIGRNTAQFRIIIVYSVVYVPQMKSHLLSLYCPHRDERIKFVNFLFKL